jgi:hypothetical protein
MTKARLDGLYLLLMGSVILVFFGTVAATSNALSMVDFRVLYYPARCLIEHHDPYIESEVLRISHAEAGVHSWNNTNVNHIEIERYIYLPTAFTFTVPFAMLPWATAQMLWRMLTVGGLIVASFLVWDLGRDAPIVSGALAGFLLANCEVLFVTGNMAGIAISLCAVAVWCFQRERFALAGVLCLAISLAVKPHDTGLVWLYFLLAGGIYRKRAIQTLLVTGALSLPAVLWVWSVAPHWMQELQSNIAAFSVHGGANDPGLTSSGAHGLGMLVSLQAVFGLFRDDPRIYNTASYLACAPLLLIWAYVTLRSRPTSQRTWLALAAIAALSLLPVYHRQHDTKLLLLTVPACAMLWAEGGLVGWLALLVNTAGFVITADLPWAILLGLIRNLRLPATGLAGQALIAVQVLPVPLILLIMGIFYLWVYLSRCSVLPHDRALPSNREISAT